VTPLVLLHGFLDDAGVWEPVIARNRWRDRFDVHASHAPGHGGRPAVEPLDLDALVRDVVGSWPSDQEPAIVVGHSMGAMQGAHLAATRPELVRALVLEDPPWGAGPPPFDAFGTWLDSLLELDDDAMAATVPQWSHDEQVPWVASKRVFDRRVLDTRPAWGGLPFEDDVRALRCPVLLISGEPELGAACTDAAMALVPGVTVRVPGAGHSVRRDRPNEYDARVNAFLDEQH
jgi:pimeloyl-ACP methyl ester carboxylesterase